MRAGRDMDQVEGGGHPRPEVFVLLVLVDSEAAGHDAVDLMQGGLWGVEVREAQSVEMGAAPAEPGEPARLLFPPGTRPDRRPPGDAFPAHGP